MVNLLTLNVVGGGVCLRTTRPMRQIANFAVDSCLFSPRLHAAGSRIGDTDLALIRTAGLSGARVAPWLVPAGETRFDAIHGDMQVTLRHCPIGTLSTAKHWVCVAGIEPGLR